MNCCGGVDDEGGDGGPEAKGMGARGGGVMARVRQRCC
jgi:hypothetical protein